MGPSLIHASIFERALNRNKTYHIGGNCQPCAAEFEGNMEGCSFICFFSSTGQVNLVGLKSSNIGGVPFGAVCS